MSTTLRLFLLAAAAAVGPRVTLPGQTPRDEFIALKHRAYDANYRNDQPTLRSAIAGFERLASDEGLAPFALYHAGWTRWMLAVSEMVAQHPLIAIAALDTAVEDLGRALELRPNDADSHATIGFVYNAIAMSDSARRRNAISKTLEHRTRAVELAPENPRVMILDAMMQFYAPTTAGGNQQLGLAHWRKALARFDTERVTDSLRPHWGGALAYGWLAGMYMSMSPPNTAQARAVANKALSMRPDFWWVKVQLLPSIDAR